MSPLCHVVRRHDKCLSNPRAENKYKRQATYFGYTRAWRRHTRLWMHGSGCILAVTGFLFRICQILYGLIHRRLFSGIFLFLYYWYELRYHPSFFSDIIFQMRNYFHFRTVYDRHRCGWSVKSSNRPTPWIYWHGASIDTSFTLTAVFGLYFVSPTFGCNSKGYLFISDDWLFYPVRRWPPTLPGSTN